MNGPLTGLRVLDIATIIAAPSASGLLADYGASVVKAELPGAGDLACATSHCTRTASLCGGK